MRAPRQRRAEGTGYPGQCIAARLGCRATAAADHGEWDCASPPPPPPPPPRFLSLLDPRTWRERAERVAARTLRVRRWNRLPSEGQGPRGSRERELNVWAGGARVGPRPTGLRNFVPVPAPRSRSSTSRCPLALSPLLLHWAGARDAREPFPPAAHPPAPGTCSRHRPPAPGAKNGVSRALHPPCLWSPGVRALTVKLRPLSSLHPGDVSVRSMVRPGFTDWLGRRMGFISVWGWRGFWCVL